MFSVIENKYYQVFIQPYCIFILQELAGLGLLTCSCSSFGHFCGLFIILILILVLDSSNWCTCGGFRTWGGEQGGLKSPRSRPKVLSPDNLAIFVAQLVGKTSSIPPHQPPHPPPYGTRETGPRANTSERNDEQ